MNLKAAEQATLALAASQSGMITREQALRQGMSRKQLWHRLRTGRWRRLCSDMGKAGKRRAVYSTFTGPLNRSARMWGAVLLCGRGAVLSHESAGEIWSLSEPRPDNRTVHITVPSGRTVRSPEPWIKIHHSSYLTSSTHPSKRPPCTRVEETVFDLTQSATGLDQATALIAEAVRRGITTHARIVGMIRKRPKMRWRAEILETCGEIADGAQSILELRYVRDVERPHGLPRAQRQVRRKADGRGIVVDNLVRAYRTRIELDGQRGHTGDGVLRDMWRDNQAAVDGEFTLRFGWNDVTGRPCEIAAVQATVLTANGWTGRLRPCRPGCGAERTLRALSSTGAAGPVTAQRVPPGPDGPHGHGVPTDRTDLNRMAPGPSGVVAQRTMSRSVALDGGAGHRMGDGVPPVTSRGGCAGTRSWWAGRASARAAPP
ncbi:type IV toxin-antitoxin system AbiEi family antitoxin domain-containing protein [Rhizohabitans arisaemae]|uniref:type IV toxin-antitoxin system AbiEi family antitoxin domain-containing protein n=1 Tax=Rhizohabitans arisaemae TaxID=2720610 RepID=UPI0024B1FE36|nr:type IV toxin-antitoxin system AbiEi family antitoxin domain-containing protein [Rhizohabitans arisaemae]